MKRICFIISVFFAAITSVQSQGLEEVRGVETKINRIKTGRQYGDDYYNIGFAFINRNNFPVSIEAIRYNDSKEVDAKSFDLDSKESYTWIIIEETTNQYDNIGYVKFKAYRNRESEQEGIYKQRQEQTENKKQIENKEDSYDSIHPIKKQAIQQADNNIHTYETSDLVSEDIVVRLDDGSTIPLCDVLKTLDLLKAGMYGNDVDMNVRKSINRDMMNIKSQAEKQLKIKINCNLDI